MAPLGDAQDRLRYAVEKFSAAERELALGVGPIKERLREACRIIGPVHERDLPESLRHRLRNLRARREAVMAPMRLAAMRTGTAVTIAGELSDLARLVIDSIE